MKKFKSLHGYLLFFLLAPTLGVAATGSPPDDSCMREPYYDILYVDARAQGRGDGSSWRDAFVDLGRALRAAAATPGGKQLWLAEGIYTPNDGPFMLPRRVQLLGGFGGSERVARARDPQRHLTVLRGTTVNPTRLLVAQNVDGVTIDGLTLAGGRAIGNLNADTLDATNELRGGALLAINANLTLCRLTFEDNRATKFGGAVYQVGGSLRVLASRFSHNSVLRGDNEVHDTDDEADTDGGAISIHAARKLYVSNSRFEDNIAGDDGGAIEGRKTDMEIVKSRFLRNKGIAMVVPPRTGLVGDLITSMGAAICSWNDYDPQVGGDQAQNIIVRDSEFSENQATIGVVYVQSPPGSHTLVERSRFIRNGGPGHADPNAPLNERTAGFGRGVGALFFVGIRFADLEKDALGNYVRGLHKGAVVDSYFEGNEGGQGGAYGQIAGIVEIKNSVFYRNVARQRGGAIWSHNFLALLFSQLSGVPPSIGSLRISDTKFIENRALGQLERLQAETFPFAASEHEQTYGGGAIANETKNSLTVVNSLFLRNTSIDGDGGAIHNINNEISFFGTLVPPAPTSYGARLVVENSAFLENRVLGRGDGAAIANGGSQPGGIIMNTKGDDARANAVPSVAIISNSVFRRNSSDSMGGAIANWAGAQLSILQCELRDNTASNGGAFTSVGHERNPATLNVLRSSITRNQATVGQGGGLFARFTNGDANRNQFFDNTPTDIDWQ